MFRRNKVAILAALIFSVTLLIHPTAASVPPVAAFTYTPAKPIFRQIVVFNASASYDPDGGNITSYRWDFDDGTPPVTLDEPTAYHNYTTFGTYNVSLTVTDDEAKTDTTWQIVTIREYPVAAFTYSPAKPIVGETVTFNASLSTPEGGAIVSYEWDFDDTNVTSGGAYEIITHVYAAEGTYNVALTIEDSENLTDTTWAVVPVRDYPVAVFTWSPERPLVNEVTTFDASLSTSDGGTITSYDWDFGDDTNGTGVITTHAYATTGNYNVTLTIKDSENLTGTAWHVVTVREYPVAAFTYSPAAPLVYEKVTFNASLSSANGGTITGYRWDFDDTNVTSGDYQVITHIYTAFGTYNVTLTITDSEDLSDTFWDTVRILITPVASFIYSPTKPIVNETVTFDASTSDDPDGSIVSYRWDFGDSNVTLAGAVITHAYTAEGTYNVTLTVTDDDGLTGTVWKLITVYSFLYVHDVAIKSVAISPTEVYVGQIIGVTVVAKNEGTAVESFSVTVYYDGISVGTKPVTNLLPGSEKTLTFNWDTTGLTPSDYTISAKASVVPGETVADQADNTLTDGTAKVKKVGDVNGDGAVNVLDAILVLINAGPAPPRPTECDVNGDGTVNVLDVILVLVNAG